MFNLLLDRLPDNYKGYLIRTDFRIGMQIYSCLKDKSVFEHERNKICLKLLYGNSLPPTDIAVEGLIWFMNLGELSNKNEQSHGSSKDIISFEIDSTRIYSGFKSTFGIDLDTEKMHWFKFRSLLFELKNCHLSDVTEIRTMSTTNMSSSQKMEINRLKRLYSIDDSLDEEQESQLRSLMSRT